MRKWPFLIISTETEIDNIIQRYRHNRNLSVRDMYSKVNAVYEMMKGIKSGAEKDSHQIWIEVPRGDIKDFGDFDEFPDAGEAETYEEFENLCREFYPEETKMFRHIFHIISNCPIFL